MKMKPQVLISAASVFAVTTMLSGQQNGPEMMRELERAFQLNGRGAGIGTAAVKGKPFSATEEQHFLQVLSDGTRVETRQTTKLYRDGEGRTRMEDVTGGKQPQAGFEFGPIMIVDPVANRRTAINPQAQQKLTQPAAAGMRWLVRDAVDRTIREATTFYVNGGFPGTVSIVQPSTGGAGEPKARPPENLGMKNVNGVMARGERTVSVIPAGDIGNNREIRIVNERWYSDELQLLIKSTNTDPRFGDTTYELTGIVLGEPSASLFDVPDYPEMQVGRGGLGVQQPTGAKGRGRGKQ